MSDKKPITICVINLKGGVGKSTITALLSRYAFNTRGKDVLAIDLDPQANLSQGLLHREYPTHSQEALLWAQVRSKFYWEKHRIASSDRTVDARLHARAMRLQERPEKKPWQTVRDAIGDLPDPASDRDRSSPVLNHRLQCGARSYPGHTGSPLDEAAKTLKAGVHGVPGGENMLLRPDGTVRYFTVREAARLQTFPDEFRFHGSWTETMRQLGNAVPVDLAEFLARRIARTLKQAGGSVSDYGRRVC